jgi:undecaprenyl-diphosphatase
LAFYGFLALLALQMQHVWLRRALVAACVVVVVGIGWSRIYVGEHWPTDVLGGYLLGAAWLLITRAMYVTGTLRANAARARKRSTV